MENLLIPLFNLLLFFLLSSHAIKVDQSTINDEYSYVQCLRNHSVPSKQHFNPQSAFYNQYFSSVQSSRTLLNSFKPLLLFVPTIETHVQAAVLCSRSLAIPIRTSSGGYDDDDLSFVPTSGRFVLIDLQFLSSISIDTHSPTAWVHAGATLGELYYAIANHSRTVAFPAGPSSDNVEDIRFVVGSGEIKNRGTMGEDLFWALRGGGETSFGVILAYKLRLVAVPSKVTVFTVSRTLEEEATKVVDKWQRMAYKADKRLFITTIWKVLGNDCEADGQNKIKRLQVSFNSLFLGDKKELLLIMKIFFPELKLAAEDCAEMTWIESALYFAGYQGKPLSSLLERDSPLNYSSTDKPDFLPQSFHSEGWFLLDLLLAFNESLRFPWRCVSFWNSIV
ncbi:berberine bridge enzyme-like 15 [Phalaenopsis equestris]|uniref:berberine bridge enzyme-like 15 n=1 Tax=Phalaenopsis equestris TaxID=78828 RepID=UPI0009E4E288|nr:berberine bridge enzyme-like 15 [Phalaenopsis equestris]